MNLRYALLIAWTKVRARKVRTVLSALISAFMLVILVSMSMGFTGARNAFKSTPGISSEKARVVYYGSYSQSANGTSSSEIQSGDSIKQKYSDANITNVYTMRMLFDTFNASNNLKLNDTELSTFEQTANGAGFVDASSYGGIMFSVRSDELVREDLVEGGSLEIGDDGSIPIVINAGSLLDVSGKKLEGLKGSEKVELLKQLKDDYMGKVIALGSTLEDAKTEIKFRIVGIAPKDGLLNVSGGSDNAYIPKSVFENQSTKHVFNTFYSENYLQFADKGAPEPVEAVETVEQEPTDLFADGAIDQYIIEFASKDDLKKFSTKYSCNSTSYAAECVDVTPYRDALLEFDEQAQSFWNFAKWVVGFFAGLTALFLFFTTSKVASDSRKETGVFRAMGASRFDIAKVYITYIAIITTISYLLAILISLVILTIVTIKQADELSTTLTELTGNYAHAFDISFIGFNPMHMLGIWLLSIAVGLIGGAIPILRNVLIDPIKAMRTD